jgi:hypothetical protein
MEHSPKRENCKEGKHIDLINTPLIALQLRKGLLYGFKVFGVFSRRSFKD